MELPLDITTIKTVDDINNTDFSQYSNDKHTNWIQQIKYPVEQREFNRLYKLSQSKDSKYTLYDSMGDLYIVNNHI